MFNVEYFKNHTHHYGKKKKKKKKSIHIEAYWIMIRREKLMYCKHGLICPSKNSIILCNNSK